MRCTDCTKAYELIELPVGSSKDAIKSARKELSKTLHPDTWQNRPGWKGAASQLTNINVAIDHLLQCDRAGSSSFASFGAKPKRASDTEMPQVLRQAKPRIEVWIMLVGFCVLFVLAFLLHATRTFLSSDRVDASNQEPTSFTVEPSGIPKSDPPASSPMQVAPVFEERATMEKDVEQREAIPVTSSAPPVSPQRQ
jgi:hypothetical protein